MMAYTNQRKDLLKVLKALPETHWSRGASVQTGAKIREETVLSYAERIVDHEAQHYEQIKRILGSK
jgi:hypothetical protein